LGRVFNSFPWLHLFEFSKPPQKTKPREKNRERGKTTKWREEKNEEKGKSSPLNENLSF
jgi:hypothetical protein